MELLDKHQSLAGRRPQTNYPAWGTTQDRRLVLFDVHLRGLGALYEQLLYRLIPLPARPQETLAELVTRVEQAQAKQREVDKVSARLIKEKLFNRKVEISAHLRNLKTELGNLR